MAEDIRVRSLTDAREYTYYVPAAQTGPSGTVLIRVAGDASGFVGSVRRQMQRALPGASYVTVVPFRALVDPSFRNWQFGAAMFGAFGALALSLAALGLYALVSYNVAQRRQEIGVRMALGASRASIVRLFVGRGLKLIVAGVSVGTALTLLTTRFLEPLLFRESPRDPLVLGTVALLLVAVGVIAAAVPSIGAASVDPNLALRSE